MSNPPAHRRLVPRKPKSETRPPAIDEIDVTTPRPQVAPEVLEDDSGPDPANSFEMTARRPLLEPEDLLEHELTLQTRIDSPEDSFAQMTIERVRALSHPGDDELDDPLLPEDDEPPALASPPERPRPPERA